MRKSNFDYYLDGLFWTVLYALPFLAWIVALRGGYQSDLPSFMVASDFAEANFVFNSLKSVFGAGGTLVLFSDNLLYMFSWFINCVIIHIMVDVLLFIPRLAHHWLAHFTSGRGCD